MPTYKNPKAKTMTTYIFCFFGKFRLLITGMGRKKIAKSVRTLVKEFPSHKPKEEKQVPSMLGSQNEEMGLQVKTEPKNSQRPKQITMAKRT